MGQGICTSLIGLQSFVVLAGNSIVTGLPGQLSYLPYVSHNAGKSVSMAVDELHRYHSTIDNDLQTQERLLQADDLARGMVRAAAPLRLSVTQSLEELTAVYRLRYEVIIARGWARREDLPDGLERDEYDDRAVHIAAWDGLQIAATSRLVLPTPDRLLPTERAFEVKIKSHEQIVDMGRQIVARAYSNVQHLVFAALLGQTWLEMRARGFTLVCGDFSPVVTRLYRLMGFQVAQAGPAREFWGEERFPIVVDVVGSVPALLKRWSRFAKMDHPV